MSQSAIEGSLNLRDLTKLLRKLTSTIQAIFQATPQIRFLQQIQIQALRKSMTYKSVITLDQQAKEELSWWITNIKIYNEKSPVILTPELTIFQMHQGQAVALRVKGLARLVDILQWRKLGT